MNELKSYKFCLECGKQKVFNKFCFFCFKKTSNNISFIVKERINIFDSYQARRKWKGYRKFIYEILSWWFQSWDKRIKNWVLKTRIIDKENKYYFESVEDYTTKKILRTCEENLDKHKKQNKFEIEKWNW